MIFDRHHSDRAAARGALVTIALVVAVLLVWELSDVLLLFFVAVLIARIVLSLADLIALVTPLKNGWSRAASGLVLVLALGGFVTLLGTHVAGQVSDLVHQLPTLADQFGQRLAISDLADNISENIQTFAANHGFISRAIGWTSTLAGVASNLLFAVVAGAYLAVEPERYERGILRLLPPATRPKAAETINAAGHALNMWLVGQLASMVLIGGLIWAGLWLLGMPSALALGLIAGLFEFIPLIGPFAGAVPALLVAFPQGVTETLWVGGLFLVVQQAESNLIQPIIQNRTVDLPPVLTLFAIIALGVLFGPLGIIVGSPLTVVLSVVVEKLYLEDEPETDEVELSRTPEEAA